MVEAVVRDRSFWWAMAIVAYVASAVAIDARDVAAYVGVVVGPMWLVLGWRAVGARELTVDLIDPVARQAARATVAGAAVAIVAYLAGAELGTGIELAFRAGSGTVAVSSLVAVSRLSSLGGIAARGHGGYREAEWVVAGIWLLLIAAAGAAAAGVDVGRAGGELSLVAGALATSFVTATTIYRQYSLRRFELGVAERAAAAVWLVVLAVAGGVFASLVGVGEPFEAVPVATLVGGVGVVGAAISQEPTRISRTLRGAAALLLLTTPLISLAVVAAYKLPSASATILLLTAVATSFAGLFSPRVARAMAPERGRWLVALEEAVVAGKAPEPRAAVVGVFETLRGRLGPAEAQCELYRFSSQDRVTVDLAGYVHTAAAEPPPRLVTYVEREPFQVLSTEALREVQVYKPEVQDSVAWLDARGAGAMVAVEDEGVVVGMLVLPAAGRQTPFNLEEVQLMRLLADHLGLVTGAAAQLERARKRELAAEQGLSLARTELSRLRERVAAKGRHHRRLAEAYARTLNTTTYAPASVAARTEIETKASSGAFPLALSVPAGEDPIPWAAAAHVASAAEGEHGPFLLVDGGTVADEPLSWWFDPSSSPLIAAAEGSLVVVAPSRLTVEVQRALAFPPPEDTIRVRLILVVRDDVDALHDSLAAACTVVAVPALEDRAEDVRAIAFRCLEALPSAPDGQPLRLSLDAQERLLEHRWPGGSAELVGALVRAASRLEGRAVITALDVELDAAPPSGRRRAVEGS